jgi:GTP-binding protein
MADPATSALPVVALVGRPNVGKSTLFNALTRTRDAIVADRPGVTRDRHHGVCRSFERPFVLVDTGGLSAFEQELPRLAARQAEAAITEADLVLFVLDARDGLAEYDREIARSLRRAGKQVLLVVNKTDGMDEQVASAEFAELGLGRGLPVSASHNRGMTQLGTAILAALPARFDDAMEDDGQIDAGRIRIAVAGRPNVGKSTLANRLIGEERVVASEEPGTTRDAIELPFERDGQTYLLVDTAGIRRKGRVDDAVEKFSIVKTLQALERTQVALVLVDASEGITDQDATVLGLALDAGRALVVVVNKWDGLASDARERVVEQLDRKLVFVPWAEQVFISARHGSGIGELMAAITRAHASAVKVFSTHELTEAVTLAFTSYQPPLVQGRVAKLRYAHQGGRLPPRIVLHGNRLSTLPDSYQRYLENFLRKHYRLVGTPIKLDFREGENPFAGRRNTLTESQQRKRRRLLRHVKRKP